MDKLHQYLTKEFNKMSVDLVNNNIMNVQEKTEHLTLLIKEIFGDNYEVPDAYERALGDGTFTKEELMFIEKSHELINLNEEMEELLLLRKQRLAEVRIDELKRDNLSTLPQELSHELLQDLPREIPQVVENKQFGKGKKEVGKIPWTGTKSQLTRLFQELERVELIEKTNEVNIEGIFTLSRKSDLSNSTQNISENKIIWIGATTLLVYLFEELANNKFLNIFIYDEKKFALIKYYFRNAEGGAYNNKSLASTLNNILNNVTAPKPKKAEIINSIISMLQENP